MFSQTSDVLFVSSPIESMPHAGDGRGDLILRVCGPLTEVDAVALSSHAAKYRRATIWIDPRHRPVKKLGFLKHFPFLHGFRLWDFEFKNFLELEHVPAQIRALSLEETRTKTLSLQILRNFPNLESLWIDGHRKDFDSIQQMTELRFLCLRSLTLPDLSVLRPLQDSLRELELVLGGTSNLGILPEFRKLRSLGLTGIRGLIDIEPLSSMPSLRSLSLSMLKQIHELPDMSRLNHLRRLELDTMNGLCDLSGAAQAPNLRELSVSKAQKLKPMHFEVFDGHPTLEYASIGLGSDSKNRAVREMLGLKDELPERDYATDA